jgi:hypothetical protein
MLVETREEFLTYPQTSPEIYAWLPYHRETPEEAVARSATGDASKGESASTEPAPPR